MRILLAVLAVVAVWGAVVQYRRFTDGAESAAYSPATCRERPCVLFVGNSLTFVNELPVVFQRLARSGGHEITAEDESVGGFTLLDHARRPMTRKVIDDSPWDVVVLQEQSLVPAVREWREASTVEAGRDLVSWVRRAGARPLLFMAWPRERGVPEIGLPSYTALRRAVIEGYREAGRDLGVQVVPVGVAWDLATRRRDVPPLWSDGNHPTMAGTYLAACVFYAAILGENPAGIEFRAGLPEHVAAVLQRIAWDAARAERAG